MEPKGVKNQPPESLGAAWGLLGALGALLGALGRSWAALGRSWAALGRVFGVQDGPKGPAKRPQEQAPGRQLAPPRRDGKTSARSAHGKTSARSARETASPETPETREIYHETTTPRYRERLTFTATPDHGNARDLPRDHQTTNTATDVPFPQEHRTTKNEIYRWATRQTRQPRRPTVAPTAFSDSAFRFLSRQVTESGRSARLKLRSGRESDK